MRMITPEFLSAIIVQVNNACALTHFDENLHGYKNKFLYGFTTNAALFILFFTVHTSFAIKMLGYVYLR